MTKQATPPPPGDRPTPTAPSPPPRWRHWLWPVAALTVLLWTTLPNVQGPPKMDLSYSQFLRDVDTGQVKTITIASDGQASGNLSDAAPTRGQTAPTRGRSASPPPPGPAPTWNP